jgi:hypothetical protein
MTVRIIQRWIEGNAEIASPVPTTVGSAITRSSPRHRTMQPPVVGSSRAGSSSW